MSDYSITFASTAVKELDNLQTQLFRRIFPRIEALAKNPRPPGSSKLSGEKNRWRIRVGDYRVIYSIDDQAQIVDVVRVRHRSKAYE